MDRAWNAGESDYRKMPPFANIFRQFEQEEFEGRVNAMT
jgi:hypothetical protein